jgi:hypothetical protein
MTNGLYLIKTDPVSSGLNCDILLRVDEGNLSNNNTFIYIDNEKKILNFNNINSKCNIIRKVTLSDSLIISQNDIANNPPLQLTSDF